MTISRTHTRRQLKLPSFSLRAALALITMSGAVNAAQFTASGEITFADPNLRVIDEYNVTLPISVGRGVVDAHEGLLDFHAQADSLAQSYGLHAHAYTQVINQPVGNDGGGLYRAHAFAQASYADFVISGPQNATMVQTAINVHVSGEQVLGTHVPPPGLGSSSESAMSFTVLVRFDGGNQFIDGGSVAFSSQNGRPIARNATGMATLFNGSSDMKTMVWTLPVNVPITLAWTLDVSASVGFDERDSFIMSANTDFGRTMTFAKDQPVFDLPMGYTVNSAEAGITNNEFTVAVPEPSAAGMLALGVGLLLARRRTRVFELLRLCGRARGRQGAVSLV